MKKKTSGFTLIEMIIALAITVIILGIISSMFTAGNKVFSDSDVKSTLQIEAQAIQEKISNIGMQGEEVISTNIPLVNVESLVIKSYSKDDDSPRYFRIEKDGKKLKITESKDDKFVVIENTQNITGNLESLAINYEKEAKSIKFDILLSKKRGYSDVNYPINFTIMFRNKGY